MKFFVYGKLKSDQPKAWMIPLAKSRSYTLYGYKLYLRPEGTAGMKVGKPTDHVVGEVREVKWAIWPLNKILLWFLDLNEGTSKGIYKRVKINGYGLWTYLYTKTTYRCKVITAWPQVA